MKPTATIQLRFLGSGELCYNPANSRKTFKIIFPGKYTDKIKKVEVWAGEELIETLYRPLPISQYKNEWGNRSRYYGKMKFGFNTSGDIVKSPYPKNVVVFMTLKSGKVGSVKIKDPTRRYD